ncbi:MAG TPA: ATP-binding protein [Thermoanaerobaculia bacterium]|nr:ATP-binding protein [Thermoanaerobaculia bacterium]
MVAIRPEVAMYAAFARLNYKPWYALAEFVDNSLQSALANMEALQRVSGGTYRLSVQIDVSEDYIEIRDTAAGIHQRDYARAFRPASPPPDRSGLSEFGLGMKAASSWFARKWSVRTTALGEAVERTITFDIPEIVTRGREELEPIERKAELTDHYTTLLLSDLNVRPKHRTIWKIKEHLRSIYRLFLRDGLIELRVNDDDLKYENPAILCTPYHAAPTSSPVTWRKEINLDLGDGHRVSGWAAILARASVANAGFSIFRRRRLIQGSHGEGYRPEEIFGKPNKFIYQRLVGEFEVDGFSVSHTKDGIQWDEWEEDILAWLKSVLDAQPLPLLDQAANYRARATTDRDVVAEAALDTTQVIAQHLPPIVDAQIHADPDESPLASDLDAVSEPSSRSVQVELALEHAQRRWIVTLEVISELTRESWYDIAESQPGADTWRIHIRVNLAHPFMVRFISLDGDEIVPFLRLAAGLAIAEVTAREVGVRQAGTLRRNLNQILRSALSGPIQKGEKPNGKRE